MGEIDDLYKSEAEILDQNFLEELKVSKNHNKSFEKYRKDLEKSRVKFSEKYNKFNISETQRIRKMKKEIKGMDKFKHLEIAHFDFEFGFWDRLRMGLDIWFFNLGRKMRNFFDWIFPSWFIYDWYKVRNFFRGIWRDSIEIVVLKWEGLKDVAIKFGLWVWEKIKELWVLIKKISGKVLFWRKKIITEEDGKEKKGEGEGEKEGEEAEKKD